MEAAGPARIGNAGLIDEIPLAICPRDEIRKWARPRFLKIAQRFSAG